MNSLNETGELLRSQFEELKKECLKGSDKAITTLVFSGARCAELLAEQLLQGSSSGKTAVEEASKVANAWPISYPALDDGRTNRIEEQLPFGLKEGLKISRSYLNATGRRAIEYQEVDTFLDHALKHEDLVRFRENERFELASIMGALIVLHRECIKGNCYAAAVVAKFGVQVSELLEDLLGDPDGSKIGKALQAAARKAPEWPISLRRKEDLKQLRQRVPRCLGKDLGFRITKRPGTRADRDLSSGARSGFAFTYFKDLERGRNLSQKYGSPLAALGWELARQAQAAFAVLFNKHYLKFRPHVVQKITKELPDAIWSHAENPLAMAPPTLRDIVAITKKLLNVVPSGTHGIWHKLRELPSFSQDTLQLWIQTAISLAEIRCEGKWECGEWPPKIADEVRNRMVLSGTKSQDYLYKEAVGLWIKQGFNNLVEDIEQ